MRKLVFITGALSLSLGGIGIMFKAFHFDGASIIILVSTILFSVVFVPGAAIYYYKKGK